MTTTAEADGQPSPCQGCAINDGRRRFMRAASVAAVAAMIGGAGPTSALGAVLDVVEARPLDGRGNTKAYAIPPADSVSIDRTDDVILVRWADVLYAFNLSCPHQNTALRWLQADHRFQCPKHKSKYRPDGVFMEGRATRGMDRLEIRREGDTVIVNLDRLVRQDEDPAGWAAATIHL